MGICASAAKQRSVAIDKVLTKGEKGSSAIHKLLLLGAGESGKSTLFKQMEVCYKEGFPPEDRIRYKEIVYTHVISCIKALCNNCIMAAGKDVDEELRPTKQLVLELRADTKIDAKVGEMVKTLWADASIQLAYTNRSKFQIFDNADWYFERMDEIMDEKYLPDNDHIFRARVRTTGIVEIVFEIDTSMFRMFDVGGQRNERKKWIHCFENVTAVIFVAAVSAYDMVLYEDPSTNRVVEALHLFNEVCSSRWLKRTSKVLFLNKRDLFSKKIVTTPLNKYFPEYRGPQLEEPSLAFLKKLFEDQGARGQSRVKIYTHITCATNTENTKAVFTAVKDIVIRRSLTEVGLTL
eukprot:gb/GEZN01007986.1/.p1 GENE.gb/GEZN01007986.1/~~gb/GEZN01007986.1/.p1  ORF type:complete len:350 (+),score=29.77 gb/GEZN01007986.1/:263-1312(+)